LFGDLEDLFLGSVFRPVNNLGGFFKILGRGDFVDRVLQEAEERQLRQMKLRRRCRGIEDVIQEECRKRKVNEEELRKGSRRSRVREARAAIAY